MRSGERRAEYLFGWRGISADWVNADRHDLSRFDVRVVCSEQCPSDLMQTEVAEDTVVWKIGPRTKGLCRGTLRQAGTLRRSAERRESPLGRCALCPVKAQPRRIFCPIGPQQIAPVAARLVRGKLDRQVRAQWALHARDVFPGFLHSERGVSVHQVADSVRCVSTENPAIGRRDQHVNRRGGFPTLARIKCLIAKQLQSQQTPAQVGEARDDGGIERRSGCR